MQASPSPRSGKHFLASSLLLPLPLPILPPKMEGSENGSEGSENGRGSGNGNGNKENAVAACGAKEDERRRMTMREIDFIVMKLQMLIN